MREELRSYRSAEPFKPFFVKMADGTRHEVRHAEDIIVGKALCVVQPKVDHFDFLDINLMAEAGPID
jgi:hypothetical protein